MFTDKYFLNFTEFLSSSLRHDQMLFKHSRNLPPFLGRIAFFLVSGLRNLNFPLLITTITAI